MQTCGGEKHQRCGKEGIAMSITDFGKYFLIFCSAMLINAVFLGLIPILSRNNTGVLSWSDLNPVRVTVYSPPSLPRKNTREKIIRKIDMKPRELPVMTLKDSGMKKSKPTLSLKVSSFQFDINTRLEVGIDVTPPQEPEINPSRLSRQFGLGEVDQVPQLIKRVEPFYPYSARIRGITGKVVVKFLVDSKGYVRKPVILKATPKGIFEEPVLQAVRRWRFRPGYWHGHPVATWVVLPIRFKLSG